MSEAPARRSEVGRLIFGFAVCIAIAGGYLLLDLAIAVFDYFPRGNLLFQALSAVNLLATLCLLVGWLSLRKDANPPARPLVDAAIAVEALHLALNVIALADLHVPVLQHRLVSTTLYVASVVLAWSALGRLRAGSVPASRTVLFYVALCVDLLPTVAFALPALQRAASASLMTTASVLAGLANVTVYAVLIVVARALQVAGVAGATSTTSDALAGPRSASDDLVIGALWLVGGLVVTIGSFAMASSSSGGGHYLVTSGAIVYGIVRIVRGLARR